MAAVRRAKGPKKQTGKGAKRSKGKGTAKGAKRVPSKKKIPVKVQSRAKKKTGGKAASQDSLIQKLRKALSSKEEIIRESEKTLKETVNKVGAEVSAFKEKMNQSILKMKSKTDAEIKKLKEDLNAKNQALKNKEAELAECRKAASDLEDKLKAGGRESAGMTVGRERPGLVTFKGNPLTLLGEDLKVGDRAPDFQVLSNDMQPVTLQSFQGKIKVLSAVPSLDTPVCNMETRRFNQEAGKLPDKVAILTVSMDLPFAQSRWCAAAGVEKVKTFSDYRDRSFGLAYGVLTRELKLLARTVFIVDEEDLIRYIELVPEITREPDYDRILSARQALL